MAYRNPKTNPTPIRLGLKARLEGRDYTVAARVTKGVFEEGQHYYWDEFLLVDAQGDQAWLEHEDGAWKVMRPFMPRSPVSGPQASALPIGARLDLDGRVAFVTGKAEAIVFHIEGELPYRAAIKETSRGVDAALGTWQYSVEWKSDEIEFFRGRLLTQREVYEAFGLKAQLDELQGHERKRRSQNLFGALTMMLSLVALVAWAASGSSGRMVQSGSAPIVSINRDLGVRFGPFTLDPSRRVHRLSISGSMTQASAWVSGVVEAADETEMLAAQGDFWDESGSDSDGAWHESDLSTSTDFVVTQPGPVFVRIYTEPEALVGSSGSGYYGNVSFELRDGVVSARWLGWFALLGLPVALWAFAAGSKERIAKWSAENSD
jgi:hypothetical protein